MTHDRIKNIRLVADRTHSHVQSAIWFMLGSVVALSYFCMTNNFPLSAWIAAGATWFVSYIVVIEGVRILSKRSIPDELRNLANQELGLILIEEALDKPPNQIDKKAIDQLCRFHNLPEVVYIGEFGPKVGEIDGDDIYEYVFATIGLTDDKQKFVFSGTNKVSNGEVFLSDTTFVTPRNTIQLGQVQYTLEPKNGDEQNAS